VRIDRPDDADGRGDPDLQAIRASLFEANRGDAGEAGRDEPGRDEPDIGEPGRDEPDIEPDAGKRVARTLDNRAKVDAAVRAYAIDQGYERVSEIEKGTVTPAMRRIEAEDPGRHLAGLENRLKGKDRLAEKVEFDVMKKGRTVHQAFANVKDAIRYTFVYDEAKYTAGVYADCERLIEAGFVRFDRRNSWDGGEYKGINSRWRIPGSSQLFEVQFHTRASLEAKEETHSAYERIRSLPQDDEEIADLRAYQREVTSKVPIPPGALGVPGYRFKEDRW
jgi:hypothetical protein